MKSEWNLKTHKAKQYSEQIKGIHGIMRRYFCMHFSTALSPILSIHILSCPLVVPNALGAQGKQQMCSHSLPI